MSDIDLIVFGCVVSFIALGGAYLFLRSRFEETSLDPALQPVIDQEREVERQTPPRAA